ncbi:hypothetical protein D3C73_1402210 [compost metagenome]
MHLKRQADGLRIGLQRFEFGFFGTAAGQGTQLDAGFDQRARLVPMHELKGFLIELQTDRTEVDGLTADHPGGARRQR